MTHIDMDAPSFQADVGSLTFIGSVLLFVIGLVLANGKSAQAFNLSFLHTSSPLTDKFLAAFIRGLVLMYHDCLCVVVFASDPFSCRTAGIYNEVLLL